MKSLYIHSFKGTNLLAHLHAEPEILLKGLEQFVQCLYPEWPCGLVPFRFAKTSEPDNGWALSPENYSFVSGNEKQKLEVRFSRHYIHEPIGDHYSPSDTDIVFIFNSEDVLKFDGRINQDSNKFSIFVYAKEGSKEAETLVEVLPDYFMASLSPLLLPD